VVITVAVTLLLVVVLYWAIKPRLYW